MAEVKRDLQQLQAQHEATVDNDKQAASDLEGTKTMTAKLADGVVERVMQHTGPMLAEVAPPGYDKDAGVWP
eukprot:6973156-Prorocentrum_lima.AAC.1